MKANLARQAMQQLAAQVITGPASTGGSGSPPRPRRLDDCGELSVFGDLARDGAEEAILQEISLLLADTA
jgi:hypothetical protein